MLLPKHSSSKFWRSLGRSVHIPEPRTPCCGTPTSECSFLNILIVVTMLTSCVLVYFALLIIMCLLW